MMKKAAPPDRRQRSLLQFFAPNATNDPTQIDQSVEPRKPDAHEGKVQQDDENTKVSSHTNGENLAPVAFEKFKFRNDAAVVPLSEKKEEPLDIPTSPAAAAISPIPSTHVTAVATTAEGNTNTQIESISPSAPSPIIFNADQAEQPNAYEQARLERIQRNMEVMRSLGLGAGGSASLPLKEKESAKPHRRQIAASKKRPRPAPQAPSGPLRRSTRQRGGVIDVSTGEEAALNSRNQGEFEQQQVEEEQELKFDDSSVHHYVCQTLSTTHTTNTSSWEGPTLPDTTIRGFIRLPSMLVDPSLARAYSVDWRPGLVAAAGKDGQAVVWGSRELESGNYSNVNTEEEGEEEEEREIAPLVSAKLHKGWISDIQLCDGNSSSDNNGGVLLLSAGNDGAVCLWDISKTAAVGARKEMPRCLARGDDLHRGGVFSMHAMGRNVVTGSKDCSVVVSRYGSSGGEFSVVRRYEDLHDGVVKCVRWRPFSNIASDSGVESSVFASCGNDRTVKISDIREGSLLQQNSTTGSEGIVLDGFHSTTVNCLRWSPAAEYLLLSASHDPTLVLHDLRRPDTALYTFIGHSTLPRIKNIYQPAFVAGGAAVATAGDPAHQLSLYSVLDGRTISKGEVDVTIGATFCGSSPNAPLLCSANRCVVAYAPKWEIPDCI